MNRYVSSCGSHAKLVKQNCKVALQAGVGGSGRQQAKVQRAGELKLADVVRRR